MERSIRRFNQPVYLQLLFSGGAALMKAEPFGIIVLILAVIITEIQDKLGTRVVDHGLMNMLKHVILVPMSCALGKNRDLNHRQ